MIWDRSMWFKCIKDIKDLLKVLIFILIVLFWSVLLKMEPLRFGTVRKEGWNTPLSPIPIRLSSADREITSSLEGLTKWSIFGRLVFMTVWRRTSTEVTIQSMQTERRLFQIMRKRWRRKLTTKVLPKVTESIWMSSKLLEILNK